MLTWGRNDMKQFPNHPLCCTNLKYYMYDWWLALINEQGGLPKNKNKILSQKFQNFRESNSRPSSYKLHRDNSNNWDISITLLIIRKLIVFINYCWNFGIFKLGILHYFLKNNQFGTHMSIINHGYGYLKIWSCQFELEKFVHTLSKAKLYKCKNLHNFF